MVITNKTSVELHINGYILKPGESNEYAEACFNTLSIHSGIGSCEITTEYSERSFKNYGKIVAKEGRKKDKQGLRNILVTAIE